MSLIQLDPDIEQRLREAVLMYLDDLEDLVIASDRLNHPSRRWTLEDVERDLGLEVGPSS